MRSKAKQRSVRDKDFQILLSNGRVVPVHRNVSTLFEWLTARSPARESASPIGQGRDRSASAVQRQPQRAAEHGDGLGRRGQSEPPVGAVAADRVEPEDPAVAPNSGEQRKADRYEGNSGQIDVLPLLFPLVS
jgi:hypothetical protein